jgi:hypothetical protein
MRQKNSNDSLEIMHAVKEELHQTELKSKKDFT